MSTWSDLKNNPRLKQIYDTRMAITKLIREFFWSRSFVETDTPIAVRYPSQELYLNPVPVMVHDPQGREYRFYMHTSPEFAMKKLLAAGYNTIFQITKCFRDYESFGGNHNTEFAMLEWYRAPGTYQEIMDDTERLFKYIGEQLGTSEVRYKGRAVTIAGEWSRLSMKEVWQRCVGVNLDEYLTLEAIKVLAHQRGYQISNTAAYEDAFYLVFLNEIEPKLGLKKPVFIYDFPVQMASLSRVCDYDSRYAERFELYIGGLELANAYGELTDPVEQKKRLEHDKEQRIALGKETYTVDPDFIAALQSGIPAGLHEVGLSVTKAGGIAMGVDRMVVLFTGAKDINEVIFQSVKDQLEL